MEAKEDKYIEQLAANFYTRNLSIVVAGCLGLLATKIYNLPSVEWNIRVWLSIAVTILLLFVTYFEYYYFLIIIRRTNHLMDVFSPLILGVFESVSISCFVVGPKEVDITLNWWVWQAIYAGFGAMLLCHSFWYSSAKHVDSRGEPILRKIIASSLVLCIGAVLLLLAGRYFASVGYETISTLSLVGVIIVCAIIILKDNWYLVRWQEVTSRTSPT